MIVKNDVKQLVLTKDFITALRVLMTAHIEMMRMREPEYQNCWVIGACTIEDISTANGMSFHFGTLEDKDYLIKNAVCFVEVALWN